MSTPHSAPVSHHLRSTPATHDRVQKSLDLRIGTAEEDASIPAAQRIDNGDEARYADKCGTYTKAVLQDTIGRVNPGAYATFKKALDSGKPADFDNIILGGPRTLNGPQGGLAYLFECKDSSQFYVAPAPALESELYATELVELYWASLLRDVAFNDYAANDFAITAANELSALAAYRGPRRDGKVTTDLLFHGDFAGETVGPYLSQFLLQDTSFGALPVVQKYTTAAPNVDFMLDPTTFQGVQNGIATGLALQIQPPVYMHDGRGLAAYTHVDVLYEAYLMAYLVLNSLNGGGSVPLNPGNPYNGDKTQNGFGTFGQPDIAAMLGAASSAALKAVWYQKWFVHLRHRPESGGALVYLQNNPQAGSVEGRLSGTVLHSTAVRASFTKNASHFLSQAFPEGSPTHPAYPTGHGAVAGACITVLKFFFDGAFVIPTPVQPTRDGSSTIPYTGNDAGELTVNGELNKLARNISFGHGIHAGIHWRSDTDTSLQLGEAVALSLLEDSGRSYNEKFSVDIQRLDGSTATISNL